GLRPARAAAGGARRRPAGRRPQPGRDRGVGSGMVAAAGAAISTALVGGVTALVVGLLQPAVQNQQAPAPPAASTQGQRGRDARKGWRWWPDDCPLVRPGWRSQVFAE